MTTVNQVLLSTLQLSYGLLAKTQTYHWNVKGSDFFQLHVAFQQQYEALFTAIDEIAERLRTLGGTPIAGSPAPANLPANGNAMVEDLMADHAALSQLLKEGIKTTQDAGDEVTVDLLIGRQTEHDKTRWMLAAYLGR